MSSSTRHEPPILDAPADLLTMAVTRSDESPAPTPAWTTIEQVFTALESPLLIYARRLVGDFNVAEDIVQEAFMKLHTQFQSVAAPQPWLYRTVHNLAVDHQRRASRITLVGNSSDDETNPSPINEASDAQPLPDEQIARWEGIGLVRLVLETLDERSRELIRLRFHEELSYKEIAARTGLQVGHVGYLLHHALKAMAAELEGTEVGR
jgi:RNA polymerase sigma-70 factor (ECF subfamily)